MARYKGVMIRSVTYLEEIEFDADDDFEARDITCELALSDAEFKETFHGDDWDFAWAEKISD